jgi:predicted CoA-binding protein
VRGAECAFGAPQPGRLAAPDCQKIDKLIHPKRIGIIGVSGSGMNFGRIILRNLMGSGYPKEQLLILKPGEAEIDGVKCVEGLKALDGKLDMLIVAVAASAVYELVDEIIASDAVEAVMLIPGSLGETKKSREPAAQLAARINAAHGKPGGGPIFLGANCLGVVSHPGAYDSWFIPLERLPKPQKKPVRNSVMLSQSGAFMITRLSQNPWLDPAYMLALGNQTDLTHGDMLELLRRAAGHRDARHLHRGLQGPRRPAVRQGGAQGRAERQADRRVQVRPHGAGAGRRDGPHRLHCRRADAVRIGGAPRRRHRRRGLQRFRRPVLHRRRAAGQEDRRPNRLGAISGAGFEAVGMADNIESDSFAMEMGAPEEATVKKVEAILVAKKLDQLVEVRNPLDINPGADDEAHLQIRSLPAGPEHRRRGGRPRPDRALGARAGGEQAAPRPRHQRPEEHGAPDAAHRRAQRQAAHRHRGRRHALRRHGGPADGPRRLRLPQLRARHQGAGALCRGAAVCRLPETPPSRRD